MGVDKEGHPILYQSFSKFNEKRLMQMTEDEYVRYTIYKIELAMFIV